MKAYTPPSIQMATALAMLLTSAEVAAQGGTVPQPPPYIRMATFNIAAKPWPEQAPAFHPNCSDKDDIFSDEGYVLCRAEMIADRIADSNYDIVVLNEAFEGETRRMFADRLGHLFQHVIYRLEDSGDTGYSMNSGLIIMSKFPLAPFTINKDTCEPETPGVSCTSPETPGPGITCTAKDRIAFRGFGSECNSGGDCYASKGVGYVRIAHPSGTMLNLFATHLQASYGQSDMYGELAYADGALSEQFWVENLNTRAAQLKVIKDFINCMTTSAQRTSEIFLVAGDININGDLSNPIVAPGTQTTGRQRKHNLFEWDRFFNKSGTLNTTVGDFFTTQVHDAWAYQMTPQSCLPPSTSCPVDGTGLPDLLEGPTTYDRGFTIYSGQSPDSVAEERLDYILLGSPAATVPNGPPNIVCAQHMTRAWNLFVAGNAIPGGLTDAQGYDHPTSDHFGLNLEMGKSGAFCNPTHALTNPSWGTDLTLPHERGAQWIEFSTPGTYTFSVNPKKRTGIYNGPDNGLDYDVYKGTDLSRPVKPQKEVTEKAQAGGAGPVHPGYIEKKLHMPEAPFFVKVYHPADQTAFDPNYTFYWHRNNCTTQGEACTLLPYDTDEALAGDKRTFPNTAPDEAWFSIQIDKSDGCTTEMFEEDADWCHATGATQTLYFFASQPIAEPAAIAKIELLDTLGNIIYAQATPTTTATHRRWEIGPKSDIQLSDDPGVYFIRVTRAFSQSPQTFDYWVGWTTNLTWLLEPALLRCDDTQEWGEDEIWAHIDVDGHSPVYDYEVASMDETDSYPTKWLAPFFHQAINPGSHSPWAPAMALRRGIRFVEELEVWFHEDDSGFQASDESDNITILPAEPTDEVISRKNGLNPGSGDYMVYYKVSHTNTGQPCETDNDCNSATTCRSGFCM